MNKTLELSSASSNFSTSCGSLYSLGDQDKGIPDDEGSLETDTLRVEPLETLVQKELSLRQLAKNILR